MQKLPFSLVQPGMVLAREVVRGDNPNGPPICGKGVELTESLIERLRNMGINSITVQGHPIWMEGDKSLPELLEDLEKRFSRSGGNPRNDLIKKIYRDIITKSMGE